MNGNEPAFPMDAEGYADPAFGLTKRGWMAAMCLQGMLAREHSSGQEANVEWAVNYADALLEELKGGE